MQLYDGQNQPIPSKFRQDKNGFYWEKRFSVDDGDIYMPAPAWAGNINAYLFEGPNIYIDSHEKPICDVPELRRGAMPVDDGNLLLTDEEKNELLRTDPQAEKLIRPFMNGKDFIYNIPRYCLWLKGVEPADIRKCPRVLERIEKVRKFRLKSNRSATKKAADTPMLFDEITECNTNYLVIPKTSSERRKYIPIGWLSPDVIAGDALFVCENATLYQFGVLNSSVHMAWVRKISGRLTNRLRYSNTIDYNAFPWPDLPEVSWYPEGNPVRLEIQKTAQEILDARKLYPRSTLADLYDERTMPPELRKAHQRNDEAVMKAYGFKRHFEDERFHEEDIVISLMYQYKELTGCEEVYETYPNLPLWESYYGSYNEEEEEEE